MKVVYDTCLYIDLLRSSKRLDLFQDHSHLRFLSPIVLMELRAGASHAHQTKILDQLFTPYLKALRVISLDSKHFYQAGILLSDFSKKSPLSKSFSHDLLIALSAKSIGATLYTNNKKDFEKISQKLSFKLELVD